MNYEQALDRLRRASDTQAFFAGCDAIAATARHVRVDEQACRALAGVIRNNAPCLHDWRDYLHPALFDASEPDYIADEHARMKRAFFELAVSCTVNAGYSYQGSDGYIHLWEKDGADVQALMACLDAMWRTEAVPGIHLHDECQAYNALHPIFNGAPYRDARARIMAAFAEEEVREKLDAIIDRACQAPGHYHLDFDALQQLGRISAEGFGEDPFVKKQALLHVMLAGYGASQDIDVRLDPVLPADYRVPQTLNNAGVLRLSDDFHDAIENAHHFEPNAPEVTELRAASIICARNLLDHIYACGDTDIGIQHIDGFLWLNSWLFEKTPDQLNADENDMRKKFEDIRVGSRFAETGFMQATRKPIAVATLRF